MTENWILIPGQWQREWAVFAGGVHPGISTDFSGAHQLRTSVYSHNTHIAQALLSLDLLLMEALTSLHCWGLLLCHMQHWKATHTTGSNLIKPGTGPFGRQLHWGLEHRSQSQVMGALFWAQAGILKSRVYYMGRPWLLPGKLKTHMLHSFTQTDVCEMYLSSFKAYLHLLFWPCGKH